MNEDSDISSLAESKAPSMDTTSTGGDAIGYSHTGSIIPLELFPSIINHVRDRITLSSMLLLSKFVSGDVERKLYYNIRLETPRSHRLFLRSVLDTKRPHLACYVHQYFLFRAPVMDDKFNASLTRALVTFVNLKLLSFVGVNNLPSAQVFPTEIPCPFQLHTFHWNGGRDRLRLEQFLSSQKSLEVLTLFQPLLGPAVRIPSDSLKGLRAFTGPIEVITEILPGRENIMCLHWDPYVSTLPIDISLIPSFSRIRILSFGIVGARPLLGAVLPLLEHLQVLELGQFDAEESVDLYKLTSLRTLVISYYSPSRDTFITPRVAFQKMKYLKIIDLAYQTQFRPNPHSQSYERWVRDTESSVEVGVHEAVWWRGVYVE